MSDKKGEKQKLREKWQFYGLLFSLNIGGVMFLVIAIFQYFELKDAFLNPVELGQFCFYGLALLALAAITDKICSD